MQITNQGHLPPAYKQIKQEDKDTVRDLAQQVAEFIDTEENRSIRKRWADVNALRKPDRAPVWCRPVGCWTEILPEDSLVCQDPWMCALEMQLRRILHKMDIGDDTPLSDHITVMPCFEVEPANHWGVDIQHHRPAEATGAWSYQPPLKSEADFGKLVMPRFSYNASETSHLAEVTQHLLGDIIQVRLEYMPSYDNATLGTSAADLRGLEQMMMDMITEPHLMHSLMTHLRDARMRYLDTIENRQNVLAANTDEPMLLSDPIGDMGEKATLANCWCAGNSQEFDQVSPGMWEEFCLNYQRPIFKRFGYVCYGCCENLTRKIDGVLSIENLRIFVCSAWTDLDVVLSKINKDYCIMWRQKAGDVVMPDSLTGIREQTEESMKKLKGQYYQIVLRELQTLAGHPDRLHRWTDMAKELASKYA